MELKFPHFTKNDKLLISVDCDKSYNILEDLYHVEKYTETNSKAL